MKKKHWSGNNKYLYFLTVLEDILWAFEKSAGRFPGSSSVSNGIGVTWNISPHFEVSQLKCDSKKVQIANWKFDHKPQTKLKKNVSRLRDNILRWILETLP